MKIAIIDTYSNGFIRTIVNIIGEYSNNRRYEIKYFFGRVINSCKGWKHIRECKFNQFFSNGLTFLTGNVGSLHVSSIKRLRKDSGEFESDVVDLLMIFFLKFGINFLINSFTQIIGIDLPIKYN